MQNVFTKLAAVAVVAFVALNVYLGLNLMPSKARAEQVGTIVPWMFTWGMISITAVVGVVLAGYLAVSGNDDELSHGA